MSITLHLAWPDSKLHSHNTGHWRGKHAVVASARSVAKFHASSVKVAGMPWEYATVSLHFRMPDRRNRDLFNLCQSMKPSIDGIVDAGLIVDDSMDHLGIGTITWCHAKNDPGVDVTIERLGDERKGK